jgi:hypothetical protein
LEGHRWHGEKVEGDDGFPVILEESKPLLTRVAAALDAPEIAGHGPFGDDEAEFQKFFVDLGCAPAWILVCQASDHTPELLGDFRPSAARAGPPAPVETKTDAVPADNGLWPDNDRASGL